jgi:tetratricopeptide (TPR) repeat protein
LAGLIFAIHPVNVESVAWITERKNTLPMVFYCVSILFFLNYEKDRLNRWYFLSLFAYLLALLSKTSVVMLPFVLLACAWWQQGRLGKKDVLRSIPFFALSLTLGLLTVWFQYNVAIGEGVVRDHSFLERLAIAGWAVWFYLYKAFTPINLSFIYPRWRLEGPLLLSYLPLFALLGLLLLFWKYRKGWGRPFCFSLGYFVVTLFPVLGFFDINFMRYSFVTDHWQYTSIIGVIALVVGLGSWLSNRWPHKPRQLAAIAAVFVVGLLSVFTWNRCYVFRDLEPLWRDTISKNPKAWMAHNNLGTLLARQGKIKEAIDHCREALRINPRHAYVHGALAEALAADGRLEEATYHYLQGVKLKPDFFELHNDLGLTLEKQGKVNKAEHHYAEAVRINPDFAEGRQNLGMLLAKQGRLKKAKQHFAEGVRISPNSADAHYNLGLALAMSGQPKQAIRHLSEALRIRPDFAEAHFNLGAMLGNEGRLDQAIEHFSEALRIRPNFPEAKHHLKQALKDAGKLE